MDLYLAGVTRRIVSWRQRSAPAEPLHLSAVAGSPTRSQNARVRRNADE